MMNLKDARRHLPPSPATPKEKLKQPRGGVKYQARKKDEFEKELEEQLSLDKDMHPEAGSTASESVKLSSNVFCFAALAEKEKERFTQRRDKMEKNEHKLVLNVTDNQAARPLKALLKKSNDNL